MDSQALLLHQVHPAKLGTDIAAAAVSTMLLWRHHLWPGLLVRYLPAITASLLLCGGGGQRVAALAATPAGRYVLAHMPLTAQLIRLAGDVLMTWAAWRRRPALLAAGLAVVAAGWSHGLLQGTARADT
jgi:hypothetical protein